MPSSDYAAATSGALKLKGGSGIDKKRKKKKKPKPASPAPVNPATEHQEDDPATDPDKLQQRQDQGSNSDLQAILASEDASDATALAQGVGRREKTEAERRHDERRRRRLDERLKREGVKTHKERVEELNRYLSGLSEHHDMPRIGPG
ncbi:DUF1754-domain-containing protein [Mytilinidion resinicola]|uniref:DUF1754-domain-containing protein n=1 Tax=Mytilinidion resinicola TaxID=574789 RepID=A0A6A6ZBJ0_9PEZI|nr:DUF1754-domain-containing protein [Mytilinidion resinicola]KAF2817674.1 DUF1754-domain-containing protein [Mytilinidion resinicola]